MVDEVVVVVVVVLVVWGGGGDGGGGDGTPLSRCRPIPVRIASIVLLGVRRKGCCTCLSAHACCVCAVSVLCLCCVCAGSVLGVRPHTWMSHAWVRGCYIFARACRAPMPSPRLEQSRKCGPRAVQWWL